MGAVSMSGGALVMGDSDGEHLCVVCTVRRTSRVDMAARLNTDLVERSVETVLKAHDDIVDALR